MLGEFEKEVERCWLILKRGTSIICSGSYGKKCDTETKENESADFVGCFLAGGYSY
jgi:hypothetical protein